MPPPPLGAPAAPAGGAQLPPAVAVAAPGGGMVLRTALVDILLREESPVRESRCVSVVYVVVGVSGGGKLAI